MQQSESSSMDYVNDRHLCASPMHKIKVSALKMTKNEQNQFKAINPKYVCLLIGFLYFIYKNNTLMI